MSEEIKKEEPEAKPVEAEPKNEEAEPKKETATEPSPLLKDEVEPVDESQEDKQWYVAQTYSGRERAVADSLEKRKNSLNFKNQIFRIVVAEYEEEVLDKNGKPVMDKKTGKPKTKVVNFYPGYVFIEMKMSDEAWYMVRNTPDVTGFVGSSGGGTKPFPVPKDELEPILKRLKIAGEDVFTDYKVGDNVRAVAGVFEGQDGTITAINPQTREATVSIVFFGRPSSITLKFAEIEKL